MNAPHPRTPEAVNSLSTIHRRWLHYIGALYYRFKAYKLGIKLAVLRAGADS